MDIPTNIVGIGMMELHGGELCFNRAVLIGEAII
jgi:hypothetical protein